MSLATEWDDHAVQAGKRVTITYDSSMSDATVTRTGHIEYVFGDPQTSGFAIWRGEDGNATLLLKRNDDVQVLNQHGGAKALGRLHSVRQA